MTYFHTSIPEFRTSILKHGLLPMIGEQRCFGNENLPPCIFLSGIKAFESTYDDDIYEVLLPPNQILEVDTVMDDSYYTTAAIPLNSIKIIHYGTGDTIG